MAALPTPDARLRIQLLGSFQLTYQDKPIPGLHPLRLQSLLAALVLNRGQMVSRQQLAFRFWTESSEGQARTNLRHLLHTLRSVLPQAETYLQLSPEQVGWNFNAPACIDVIEFETAARQASSLESAQAAVSLYTGTLMPDCYEDWISEERSRLQELYHASLNLLIEKQVQTGDYTAAQQTARKLLQDDPLNERIYCRLMALHAALGDKASVQRIYKQCASVLRKELGIQPDRETQAAYQASIRKASTGIQEKIVTPIASGRGVAVKDRNLPAPLDRLVGRKQEKESILKKIHNHRLVTLTGFGGVGKTRLAQAVGWEISNRGKESLQVEGVWWIDLAAIADPAHFYQAIAAALHIPEQADRPMKDSLLEILAPQQLLVVVDNCEHLLESTAQFILSLLKTCPAVRVLATSRVSLHLQGESIHIVPPLSIPVNHEETLSESEILFCERADCANPAFSLKPEYRSEVRSICRRLDGIPLAIELAAARTRMLSCAEIARRLDDVFQLLAQKKQGALPRHQTLRATLDWSYNLLPVPEQLMLRRISLFPGSFSLPAAEAVTSFDPMEANASRACIDRAQVLDLLAGLVEHSLLGVEESSAGTRYRLHEVTRQYASEKMALSGEEASLLASYLRYYRQLTQQAETGICGEEQIIWLRRIDGETDNLQAALAWSLSSSQPGWIETGLEIVGAIWLYWFIRGRLEEGLTWTEKAIQASKSIEISPAVSGKVFYTAASLALFQGLTEAGEKYTEISLEKCIQAQDALGTAISLHHQSMVASRRGDHDRALAYNQEGLELTRQAGNGFWEHCLLIDRGNLEESLGNYEVAHDWYQQSLETARQTRNPFSLAYALLNLAFSSLKLGNLQAASQFNNECEAVVRDMDDPRLLALSLSSAAEIALGQDKLDQAEELLKTGLPIYAQVHDRDNILFTLEDLAMVTARRSNPLRAVRLLGASQNARQNYRLFSSTSRAEQVEAFKESLYDRVGIDIFEQEYQAGMKTSLEQAIALALEKEIPVY